MKERVQPKTGKVVVPKGRESSKTMSKKLPNGGARPVHDASKITGKVSSGKKERMTSMAAPKASEKDMTSRPPRRNPRDT
jgi:hypothetical protein